MTLGEIFLRLAEWFLSGQYYLFAGEFLELTLGQALFTVFIVPAIVLKVIGGLFGGKHNARSVQ